MKKINALPDADKPEDALAAVVALREMADRLEQNAVKCAIQQGWTWEQVAQALGVSRQAAHKRHASHLKKSTSSKAIKKKRSLSRLYTKNAT